MKLVEGKNITVFWLDDNYGKVLKALVYIGTQYICEAIAKPTYSRSIAERTPQCEANREIMSKYEATINAFARKQKAALKPLTIIDNTPKKEGGFTLPGRQRPVEIDYNAEPEILPEPVNKNAFDWPETNFVKDLIDRF